jgi:hypothetical protein
MRFDLIFPDAVSFFNRQKVNIWLKIDVGLDGKTQSARYLIWSLSELTVNRRDEVKISTGIQENWHDRIVWERFRLTIKKKSAVTNSRVGYGWKDELWLFRTDSVPQNSNFFPLTIAMDIQRNEMGQINFTNFCGLNDKSRHQSHDVYSISLSAYG